MLYYRFRNYEEFKEIFAVEKRNNGAEVRKNKILLSHLKNAALLKYCRERNDFTLLDIKDMAQLQQSVTDAVCSSGKRDDSLPHKVELIGCTYWSGQFRTDESRGICEDGDYGSIRYVNMERSRVFKMKSAKFLRAVMLETSVGKVLSPSVVNWLCGDVFTKQWYTFTLGCTSNMELHVDNNFEAIYDSYRCKGDFNSCMTDKDRHFFYLDSVKAKAAYLKDEEGKIVARAVLFTEVTDQDNRRWRLLERQYTTGEDEMLKYMLVNKLIQENRIDGYKIVGASCHEANAFVGIDGSSLFDRRFEIDCDLGMDNTLSYQDSFKWYDYDERKAYNYKHSEDDYLLDTTDRNLNGDDDESDEAWDEYHQRYCTETRVCYMQGREIEVDVDDLEDFNYISSCGDYYHHDDTVCCDWCEGYCLTDHSVYSEITEEYYCCEQCREDAESSHKENYWHYSEYDKEWFEDADELTEIHIWNPQEEDYRSQTIHVDTVESLLENGQAGCFEDEYYDLLDPETGLPLNYSDDTNAYEEEHEYATVEEAV